MKKNLSIALILFCGILRADAVKTVGTGGNYTTLYAAFNAINNGQITGAITLQIISNISETYSSNLRANGNNKASYTSIVIYPTTSGVTISCSNQYFVYLDSASNVTIDGRVNRTGMTKALTLDNTYGAGPSITVGLYSTSNITLKHLILKGSSTSYGTVYMDYKTSAGRGCINTLVDSCDFTNSNGVRPVYSFYTRGNTTYPNSGTTLSNCNFYDVIHLTYTNRSNVIEIYTGTADITVTGNSIYETGGTIPASSSFDVRLIDSYIGTGPSDITITNNYIGGTAPRCGGDTLKTTAGNNAFYGIYLSGTANFTATGNTIQKINWYNPYGTFNCFYAYGITGTCTISNNIIGSPTGNGNITVTAAGNLEFYGIKGQTLTGTVTLNGNTIGGVTLLTTNVANNVSWYGIFAPIAGTANINLIGSRTTANSVIAPISTAYQVVVGIGNSNSTAVVSDISGNTIANLTNYVTNVSGYTAGIDSRKGTVSITNDSIMTLRCMSTSSSSDNAVIGISESTSGQSGHLISGNVIFDLADTSSSFAGYVTGIICSAITTGSSVVKNNLIYGFSANVATARLAGIRLSTGNWDCYNNMISLGEGVSVGVNIFGLYDEITTTTHTINHNTVAIKGTTSGAANHTYAFIANNISVTRSYLNNLLSNERTGGTNVRHSALYLGVVTGATIDYNDYYSAQGTIAYINGTSHATLTTLRTTTGGDAYSTNQAPNFISATNLHLTGNSINDYNLVGTPLESITTDFDGATRSTSYPYIGADEATAFTGISLPTVSTQAVGYTNRLTATGNGTIAGLGSPTPVSAYGVCWNTTGSPTIANSIVNQGSTSTIGAYTAAITGLSYSTPYYVRAYARNARGFVSYGTEVTFTTETPVPGPPTVTTQAVGDITNVTATGNGSFVSLGYPDPTSYGFCWNTTGTPDTSSSKIDYGAASSTGAFTGTIAGLTRNTTYYVRAYAVNSNGVGYGTQVSFTTTKLMKEKYIYTGANQSFKVPAGITLVSVKAWGAGGAGRSGLNSSNSGGAGGYASAELTVTPEASMVVVVGGGGEYGATNGGLGGWPGGGYGTAGDASGGGGGGVTGLFLDSYTQANALIIAGSGGGGGYRKGGAGGGTVGNREASSTGNGYGGTQGAGGAGRPYGADGSALQGGNGDSRGTRTTSSVYDCAGGGGGYFGGEGGEGDGCSGGGGSAFVSGTYGASSVLTAGTNGTTTNVNPPNIVDADYISGVGVGKLGAYTAGNGMVVISWVAPPEAQPSSLLLRSTGSGPYNIVMQYTASLTAEYYLVVRKSGSAPTFAPADGSTYTTGAQGSDQIVYVGSATSATDASLSAGSYYYKIYAFNGTGTKTKYLTTTPLSGNTVLTAGSSATVGNTGGNSGGACFPGAGVSVTFPNGTTGTDLNATKTASTPASNFSALPGVRGVANMYFTITSSASSPGTYTLVLDFSGLSGMTEAKWNGFKIMKRTSSTAPWQDVTLAPINATIASRQTDGVWGKFTVSGLSSFSEFAGGDSAVTHTVISASNSSLTVGSLRKLINEAESGDIITFDTTAMKGNTITLADSCITVYKNLTIRGVDGGIILNGNNAVRVITIADAKTVRLEKLKIQNGSGDVGYAGGVWNNGNLTMVNCVVSGNTESGANGVGGILQYSAGGDNANDTLNLVNCTVAGNSGTSGFADGVGGLSSTGGLVYIYNTIIYGNTGTKYTDVDESMSVQDAYNSCIGNLSALDGVISMNIVNISDNPLFVGSYSTVHPYSILATSPCLDAGEDSYCLEAKDLKGDGRKLLKTDASAVGPIDIGAYEFNKNKPLPVELTSFTAAVSKKNVLLTWQTAGEVNNAGFDVEQCVAGSVKGNWKSLGFVKGHGTTNAPQTYTFTDKPGNGNYQYRLKQIDRDGMFEYSNCIETEINVPVAYGLSQNYPNPFNPTTQITFAIPVTGHVRVAVFNILGSQVTELFNGIAEGGKEYDMTFDASRFASGAYFYRIENGGDVTTKKMQLIR